MCNPTPSTGLIGVIAALVGAIVGGGIAALVSYLQTRNQKARETKKLLLSKPEEIHEVLSQLRYVYKDSVYKSFAAVANGRRETSVAPPIERLEMLVGFYATELSPYLEGLEGARTAYEEAIAKTLRIERDAESTQKEKLGALVAAEEKSLRPVQKCRARLFGYRRITFDYASFLARGGHQIVGPERRERVSHQTWCGEG
jgi:hypothetical protein